MAKKQHIIPTEIITVAGYSLSAMLLVFACALYLGWLPSNAQQPDGTQQEALKPQIPVIKSPDAPAKVRVGEPEQDDVPVQEPPAKTAEAPDLPQPLPEPELPAQDSEGLPELPAVQPPAAEPVPEPFKSARIEPSEHHAPERFADQEPALDPLEPREAPEEAERAVEEVPGEPQEERVEAVPDAEPAPSIDEEKSRKVETPEAEEPEAPRVRVIVPPNVEEPADKTPSVVIRFPPGTPKTAEETARDPVVVPRRKPSTLERAKAPEPAFDPKVKVIVPPVEPLAPRPKPKTVISIPGAPKKATKKDALAAEETPEVPDRPSVVERSAAPRPMPKPLKLVRAPSPPEAGEPEPEEVITPPRVVSSVPKTKRKRSVSPKKKARVKRVARVEPKQRRRPRAGRVRIHRPPPSQNISIDQDTYCLAMAIYFEAGRKSLQAQVAVTRDILHRVESFNFPNSVCEVVYQYAHRRGRCRYAFACDGRPDRPRNRAVWQRAKMLAKEQIRCGSRCGCTIDKPTLVGTSKGRNRRVIRCSATIRTPAEPRKVANAAGQTQLAFEPASSLLGDEPISPLGRTQP
ncbi:MAG: cell wall hydrolase [Pseudomonadota bacterium]